MTDTSPRLCLPYIQPSQAQKHVTHNEAMKVLDAVTQLAVLSAALTDAPATAAAGDCHLVGPDAVGAWAGRDGQIAVFDGYLWSYFVPKQGWRAEIAPEGRSLRFNGTAWVDALVLQNLEMLGIATTADSVNRFAVASETSLLTHQGAGHQLKINKLQAGDTASLVFQTNWSGRAEMGTVGKDDFSFKVSADGAKFHSAIELEGATGAVRFPSGQSYFDDFFSADGAAYAYPIPWSNPARILAWLGTDLTGHSWLFSATGVLAGASNLAGMIALPAASMNFYTGPLSGTTGAAGAVNVSIDTSGAVPRMYFENRLGSDRQFTLATLGR